MSFSSAVKDPQGQEESGSVCSLRIDPQAKSGGHVWGIILAGGEGQRVRPLMRRLTGGDLPKQYCAVIGRRSMLRHTLDRVATCIPHHRIVTVIIREQLTGWPREQLVIQPQNRETAPGILLPLLWVHARDPRATVAIFPSDHFIMEEATFMAHVCQAVRFLLAHPRLLILLGIAPDRPETAYGWIEPSEELARQGGYGLFGVRRFWEKPDAASTQVLYRQGWLWNSLVLVGQVHTFLRYFREVLPRLWEPFRMVEAALGTGKEAQALDEVYRRIPAVNLSRELLERIPHCLGILPVKGVSWSDWGEEGRILESLVQIGKAEELRDRLKRAGHSSGEEAA